MYTMADSRISHFVADESEPARKRVVVRELGDAPVDTMRAFEVPEEFLRQGRPDAVVTEEMSDPEVQAIFWTAGLA